MNGAIIPLNCAVFAESTLITSAWQAGVFIWARTIARVVTAAARGRGVCGRRRIVVITMHESYSVTTRRLTFVIAAIVCAIDLLWQVGIIVTLKKVLEIFKGL